MRAEHVPKEPSDVPQPIRFIPVDRVVIFPECSLEKLRPQSIQLREPLADQAVEFGIGSFLRAAFDDHRGEFWFLTGWEIDLLHTD